MHAHASEIMAVRRRPRSGAGSGCAVVAGMISAKIMPDAGWAIASFSGHQPSHFPQFVVLSRSSWSLDAGCTRMADFRRDRAAVKKRYAPIRCAWLSRSAGLISSVNGRRFLSFPWDSWPHFPRQSAAGHPAPVATPGSSVHRCCGKKDLLRKRSGSAPPAGCWRGK